MAQGHSAGEGTDPGSILPWTSQPQPEQTGLASRVCWSGLLTFSVSINKVLEPKQNFFKLRNKITFSVSVLPPRPDLRAYGYFHMCVNFSFSRIFFIFLHFS